MHGVPPGRTPHSQVCVRVAPRPVGSVLDTGRLMDTRGPATETSPRVTWAASISRRSHQQPTTRKFRGPRGPLPTQGVGAPVSSTADSSGNGAARLGGPRPRVAA
eukprot:7946139-Alexandrium_andersonii.AAC.1